jgi:type IV secretory pathway VirB3-like protein
MSEINEEASKTSYFNAFIDEKMFVTLSGCILIVSAFVQGFKEFLPYQPLMINFICSLAVAIARIAVLEEYKLKQIILGILQTIPIMLGSTGFFEFMKHIGN